MTDFLSAKCKYCLTKKRLEGHLWAEGPQCPECVEIYGKKGKPKKRSAAPLFYHKRHSAKQRGIDWHLSPNQFYFLSELPCFYCQRPADLKRSQVGIDRIDHRGAYEINNVVPCCRHCNTSKGTMDFKKFSDWVKQLFASEFWNRVESIQEIRKITK